MLLLIAVGCGDNDPDDSLDQLVQQQRVEELETELGQLRDRVNELEQENDELEDEVATMRTAEGLIDQLRLHLRDPQAEADMPEGWEPGMTAWGPFEVPDEVQGAYDTPGEVMAELAAVGDASLLGYDQWEVTIRVLLDHDDPDLAYGALLGWGFLDDSVVGRDIRITLTRTDDERWQPGGAEQRQHGMRGVSADQTLCS